MLPARVDQLLRRDRYVAKTTTAMTTQAKTYSVEVSPLAPLFVGLARGNEALYDNTHHTSPLERSFSTRGTCIRIQRLYIVRVRPKRIR